LQRHGIPDTSISGRRVARELTMIERRDKPGMIVSDHGAEFACNATLVWSRTQPSTGTSSRRKKPTRNGFIESFNGRMRDELLNETLFFDLDDARTINRQLNRQAERFQEEIQTISDRLLPYRQC
jgi:putative transposase